MGETKSKPNDLTIDLTFDLFDLPTSQHKAGLAGLVLQVRSMQSRTQEFEQSDVPELKSVTNTSVTICFTQQSFQAVLDDLYSAKVEEVSVASKWQGKAPKRVDMIDEIDSKTQKTKKARRFIYDVVQPNSPFLRSLYPIGEADWLKLWRDMIWKIPRAKPTTRGPFNDRAEGKPTSEAGKVWKELVAFDRALSKNIIRTCSVSSAIHLGTQAINAEAVKFTERCDHVLLLHFWQLTVLVFVPQEIDREGKGEFIGFSLAIPEVADLERFCRDYPKILSELSTRKKAYYPAAAIIDIPEQSGLEFMTKLQRVSGHKASSGRLRRSVTAIEFIHLVKAGNNVKTMTSGQIIPSDDTLREYANIVQATDGFGIRNPLFRAGRLKSLLDGDAWYDGMREMLIQRPWTMFIRCSQSPRSMPLFSIDAAIQFNREQADLDFEMERFTDMSDTDRADKRTVEANLSLLVHRLVRHYVQRKTEARSGMKWKDFGKTKDEKGRLRTDVPAAYKEAREKVASGAYLAMRSRRGKEFADYFTASICSVGQFLTESEYVRVAESLLENTDDVKTLTLLSLSANS